ncbi:MAG: hypothetical protein WDW38_000161 [Sanguina aurantia]
MMQVADCWQAPQAVAALSSVLCKLQPDLIPAAAVFALPLGLQSSPSFAALKTLAATSLLLTFGSATAIATDAPLLDRFLSLPHTAVLELLQSDKLETDAEATVLLLLSDWCCGTKGAACSEEELQQLNAFIRYSRLSTPYLTELCQHLHTPLLTVEQRMELLHMRALPEAARERSVVLRFTKNPDTWYQPCRPSSAAVKRQVAARITLRLSETERPSCTS